MTVPLWTRLALGGAASLFVGMGLGRFGYTPMVPALISSGTLTADQAGSIGAINLLGFLIGAFFTPLLRARIGEAPALRVAVLTALMSLIASIPPFGFEWLAFWRFVAGVAVSFIMIYSLSIVTRHAPPDRLGSATGIVFTGVGIAILLTGSVIPWLLAFNLEVGWAGQAVLGLAASAIALWGWGGLAHLGKTPETVAVPPAGTKPHWNRIMLGLIGCQAVFSIGLIPHSIYWVDYVVRGLGNDMTTGGFYWVLFGLGAVSGTYLWGRFADRIGFRTGLALAYGSLVFGVALPVLVPSPWALAVSSLVVGAQPGLTAILSGRAHQLIGAAGMPGAFRRMNLTGGTAQAIGGILYVWLFAATDSYVPMYLAGAAAFAIGAMIAWSLRTPAR